MMAEDNKNPKLLRITECHNKILQNVLLLPVDALIVSTLCDNTKCIFGRTGLGPKISPVLPTSLLCRGTAADRFHAHWGPSHCCSSHC